MKKKPAIFFVFQYSFVLIFFFTSQGSAQIFSSDKKATKETDNLYSNIKPLSAEGFMFAPRGRPCC